MALDLTTESPNTLGAVQRHYEALPYPPREPADERRRLVRTTGDSLVELNHHCFGGRRTFRDGFRALVVGGGTGDAAIYLAEQLRETDAEIVYLDMSTASRAVAEARAQVRGLTNLRWVTASLLDLDALGLGGFDYINCSGVLHHLPDPPEGLRRLVGALAPEGAIFLMLYGRYGRRGIYEMQTVLRSLLPESMPIPERVAGARALLDRLPRGNHFQRGRAQWEHEISRNGYGDEGLYDLLLHSQDRAYTVEEIHALLASAGLVLHGYTGRAKRSYDPRHLIADPALRERAARLPAAEQQALAEKLAGDIAKHSFYAGRGEPRTASLDDPARTVILTAELKNMHEEVHRAMVPGETLSFTHELGTDREVVEVAGTAIAKALVRGFDGKTTIGAMIERAGRDCRAEPKRVREELARLFGILHGMGWAYIGNAEVPRVG